MKGICHKIIWIVGMGILSSCQPEQLYHQYLKKVEAKSLRINRFEVVALKLLQENRLLKGKIAQLEFNLKKREFESRYLKKQLTRKKRDEQVKTLKKGRGIASLGTKLSRGKSLESSKDLVAYEIYQWTPIQMISMAKREFKQKNYLKSAQYFDTFYHQFPQHKKIDDQFLFKAGLASYELEGRSHKALEYFKTLIQKYPSSPYLRGAKLWMGLIHLKMNKVELFLKTVKEFRRKYRNTEEGEILGQYYENIVKTYKEYL